MHRAGPSVTAAKPHRCRFVPHFPPPMAPVAAPPAVMLRKLGLKCGFWPPKLGRSVAPDVRRSTWGGGRLAKHVRDTRLMGRGGGLWGMVAEVLGRAGATSVGRCPKCFLAP